MLGTFRKRTKIPFSNHYVAMSLSNISRLLALSLALFINTLPANFFLNYLKCFVVIE